MNPLSDNPALRNKLYVFQWLANGILGIIGIVLTAQGMSPQWWVITQLVANFVWTYTGLTAQQNTPEVPIHADEGDPNQPPAGFDDVPPRNDAGYYYQSPVLSLLVIVAVVIVLLLAFGVI